MKKILVLFSVVAAVMTSCKPDELVPPVVNPNTPSTASFGTATDNFIKSHMDAANIPGLSIAYIKDGRLQALGSYGFAYEKVVNGVVTKVPVDKNTTFLMGGVSRAVVAMAAAQLSERSDINFNLDDDINNYLPFSVRNPSFVNVPITTRMLLAESSTIIDDANIKNTYLYSTLPASGDATLKMEDFLKDYFSTTNPAFSSHFAASPAFPGKYQEPSRIAVALASLIVEKVGRTNINEYSKSYIFSKLGTYDASWLLTELKTENMALPYDYDAPATPAIYTPLAHYGVPYFGGGQLRTSPQQMARLLVAYINKGVYGNATLLGDSTLEDMMLPAYPISSSDHATGLTYKILGTHNILGISASEAGLTTRFYFEPLTKKGVVITANCGDYNGGVSPNYIPVDTEVDAVLEYLFDIQ